MSGRTRDQEDEDYVRTYDPGAFVPFAVTVDIVLLTIRNGQLAVLLVQRGESPFKGRWALPGGFVRPDESLDDAARRELAEETGVNASSWHLEQLQSYGTPDRDPRMRVVSVAYLAFVPDLPRPNAASDANSARFWPVRDLRAGDGISLAFDHEQILADGIARAGSKLEYTSLAAAFVEEPFTIADLRRVYEAVWGVELHAANFRRKVLSTPDFVVPTGADRPTGRGHAELFTRGLVTHLRPPILKPDATNGPVLTADQNGNEAPTRRPGRSRRSGVR